MEDFPRKITPSILEKALVRAFKQVETAREQLRLVGTQHAVLDVEPFELREQLQSTAEQIQAAILKTKDKKNHIPSHYRLGDL